MTYQQRADILKELPCGAEVTIIAINPKRRKNTSWRIGTHGIKVVGHKRGMTIRIDRENVYVGYRRLTCEKIEQVEEVTARLNGEPRAMTMAELHASVKPLYTQADYDKMFSELSGMPPSEI